MPYDYLIGGVSAIKTEHFRLVNGFSNAFWGWGGEDDDFASRIKSNGLYITRYSIDIARYQMIKHPQEERNLMRYQILYL